MVTALCLASVAQAEDPIKVLQIVGEGHHDYENQKVIIEKGVSERVPSTWTTLHHKKADDAKKDLKPGYADNYDVVLYNICHAAEKDGEFIKSICKEHFEKGIPVVGLHCTMHSYHLHIGGNPVEKEWNKLLGVHSRGHGRHIPITITKNDVEHQATKDMPKEWTTTQGELYFIKDVLPNTTVLATGVNDQKEVGSHPVVWVNQYGKAKVFCTSLGHHNSTMENPIYLDMVANGLKWVTEK